MVNKANVIFMGEKPLGFKCLKYLDNLENVNIKAICTRKKTDVWWKKQHVREFAETKNIPIIKRNEILTMDDIDFIISVLYPFIVEESIILKAQAAAINLHQAPLPEYRGCNSASHAIMNGEKEFGCTLHMMMPGLDEGDIIEKRTFGLNDTLTARELYDLNDENCYNVFRDNIHNILSNNYITTTQDKNVKSYCYARDSLKNKEVNMNWSEEDIWNFVRANEFPPFEPAYVNCKGRKMFITTKMRSN